MKTLIDLGGLDWTVEAWRQWEWKLARTIESQSERPPDIGPMTAEVPGSVRGVLVKNGVVLDPYVGVQSRASEFIESRHWLYRVELTDEIIDQAQSGDRVLLRCESLDGIGEIWLDDAQVGAFANTFIPVDIDITEAIAHGARRLTVAFTTVPDDLGQIGWTSRRSAWKPRFNYGWDWTPRMVQIGVAGPVVLEIQTGPTITNLALSTTFAPRTSTSGSGNTRVDITVGDETGGTVVRARLLDTLSSRAVVETESQITNSRMVLDMFASDVKSWWAAGPDDQHAPLYIVQISLESESGAVLESVEARVGFRRISWQPAANAPDDAEPWLCHINDEPIFLQGINWVPLRPDYADVDDDEYHKRLELYKELGVNLIRVWGGAGLERPLFYDICDELGILVWQELPASSSGLDNCPPFDQEYAHEFAAIAESYSARISHHPCLAVWCGGNELAGEPDQELSPGVPLTFAHPALEAARVVLADHDPERKMVPTSPSGPRFGTDALEDFGKGIHHDVHGPWVHTGTVDEWRELWEHDDSILRSEVGIAGASDLDLIEHFGLLPADYDLHALHRLWSHSAAWWLRQNDDASSEWVVESQKRQAELLAIAATASKSRFPECAGFFVWMGHDTFPCPVSLAIVDFWGRPKPAAFALAEIFGGSQNS